MIRRSIQLTLEAIFHILEAKTKVKNAPFALWSNETFAGGADESRTFQVQLAAFVINHRRLTPQNVCAKNTVTKLFALPSDNHIDV